MRISVRLAIYSVVLTAITVIICCIVLLVTTANNQIDNTIDSGETELSMLRNAFASEIDAVGDDALSETAKHSLVLFVFRKYTDASVSGSHYILTDTEQAMFNDSPIDPRPLLPDLEEKGQQMYEDIYMNVDDIWPSTIADLDGRKFLVAGYRDSSLGSIMRFPHEIFLVRDITNVYEGISAMGIRFALIGLITVTLSGAVMIIVIRRVMSPLKGLQKSAAALAKGQYDKRIQVRGKDEIAELGTRFNQMADAIAGHIEALEDTAEKRKLLMSALTHELKTPMTAIIGYSEALMRVHLNKMQQEESVRYINSECKRVERLAQKMMQLIMLQDGEPAEIKRQPITQLYEVVDMTLQSIVQKENIKLTLTEKESPMFEMDVDMMASVLINLFDNARKAGAMHITIVAEGNAISVKDDGAGIPSNELSKITQPFYIVDKSHSQSIGGSGLGLALCVLIIKAHRATLHIESELGVGTNVVIHFPGEPA